MKHKKPIALLLTLVMLIAALASCTGGGETPSSTPTPTETADASGDADAGDTNTEEPANAAVEAIRSAGVLKVGCKEDVPNFGILDITTKEYTGLEIDIAGLLATEIFGDPSKVRFQGVTAATRGPLLDNSDIDMVIATFTITEERKLTYNFSDPYYQDAVGMLVRLDSGITSIADCDGKVIGVAQSATSRDAIQAAADAAGVSVTFNEYGTYPEIQMALLSGNVDVFCVDRSILRGYLTSELTLTDDKFSPQEYGVATKFENKELAEYVNTLIQKWNADGTIQGLIDKYGI
ncbi:MAG: transporter substrate-binding domain-containing protein [Oscillospiraceae bacterium]|jgi:putative glutamine transport system substrate-binding protein|nr:transporter substrate-binding domain-containing protein [Oscillospiraceae bacterium]